MSERMTGARDPIRDLCAQHGVTLTPETSVDTERIGMTCFAYVGTSPYSVIARHEDRGVKTVLYVSAELLPA